LETNGWHDDRIANNTLGETMKYLTSLLIIIMSFGVVSMAAAQSPDEEDSPEPHGRRGGHHIVFETIAEALGLEPEELHELLEADEDITLADIIIAQGGDVDAIQAQIVAAIDEVSDKDLAEIEEHVAEVLNDPLPHRGERGFGGRRGFGGDRPDGEREEAPDAGTEEAPAGNPT
jgi:hypothetical protein